MTHQVDCNPMEIKCCMKQHLNFLKPKKTVFCKKYLCDCTSCLQCNFEDCSNQNAVNNGEDDADLEEFYKETDHPEQIFDFAIVPSFVPFFFGSTIEPLQFVQIKGEDVAKKYIADPQEHCLEIMPYFQGFYLNAVHSINSRVKKFSTIPTRIVITPDEIYDIYVDFNDNLE